MIETFTDVNESDLFTIEMTEAVEAAEVISTGTGSARAGDKIMAVTWEMKGDGQYVKISDGFLEMVNPALIRRDGDTLILGELELLLVFHNPRYMYFTARKMNHARSGVVRYTVKALTES